MGYWWPSRVGRASLVSEPEQHKDGRVLELEKGKESIYVLGQGGHV